MSLAKCISLGILLFGALVSTLQAGDFLHVSPSGNEKGDGTLERPFADLSAARDAIRRLKAEGQFPDDGVTVVLAEGTYLIRESLDLQEQDSGTGKGPVVYRGSGSGASILLGGIVLEAGDFTPVTDEDILKKIPEDVRGRLLQVDLKVRGVGGYEDMPLSGHGMEFLEKVTDYRPGLPAVEVFIDGQTMPLARWPNEGYARIGKVVEVGSIPRLWQDDMVGKTSSFVGDGKGYVPPDERDNPPKGFAFSMEGERASRWREAKGAMLFGYWYHNWSDQTVQLARVDESGVLHTVQPSAYGIRSDQRFYVYNLIEELDAPGEWYLDRDAGILYLLPSGDGLEGKRIEVSLLKNPMIRMTNVSHVVFENLGFSSSRGRAVEISGGEGNLVRKCAFHRLALNAVSIHGGNQHAVIGCSIEATGAGGIILTGGDRKTLAPAGHRAEGNIITDFSRLVKTYSAAIDISGVGNHAIANRISQGPHVGIRFAGNDHLIEGNDISRVCLEADDMGAIYAGRDVSARGSIIRDNYVHDLPPPVGFSKPLGCHGVYLDDQFCGTLVERNVFRNIGGLNVVINGGRDNVVRGNTFLIGPELAPVVSGISRFAAVGISNIGMDPRRIGPDGRPPMPEDIPFDSPAYAKYPNLAGILTDDPLAPKHNLVEGNLCLGLPLFYFHQFKDTGVTEKQVLQWNRLVDNRVFTPGGKSE